ncbi:Pesticin receptor precursor [Tsuneonella dongtanensis]|uniref:Pesticin receptor n=1 Tax=Tsuneonella dongtanensis TaxID=692370 RepID=A0A1B2ACD4_9SPHN|nr:TonB-dependent receptor [Tsuneonella dongtanensis]ANY19764.1 Pesticin receptor precursor [Tsuneonella dongtanensis]
MIKTRTGFAGSARFTLLAGAAALALPGIAHAQDAADDAAVEEEEASGNQIVVTATKREQTLQEVPVAVSVTTAETIERAQIRDVTDLATVVPSLRVTQSQSQVATTYSIRGFGTSGNNIGFEPSVAMFVDGVYRSRAIAQISDLPDIQRVEVLRGPQSTLFGKNASAGVISLVTKAPSFRFGGSLEASYGNYDAMVVKGYVTGPISDSIAASLAAGYNRRDGYVTNLFNGDDLNNRNRWFARGQVLIEPSDTFKFRVIGDYDEIDEKCCAAFNLQRSPFGFTTAVEAVGGRINDFRDVPDADVVYSDVVPFSKVRNLGISGQGDLELGALTLTSISAYRDTQFDADQDVDFSSARLATGANIGQVSLKTFTQELRVASDFDGPLNFLLGGYYFNEKARSADQIVFGADFRNYVGALLSQQAPPGTTVAGLEAQFGALTGQNFTNRFFAAGQGFFNDMSQDNEAYSLFGNVDFEVSDALTITLGANYTHDAKDVTTNSVSTDVFSGLNLPAIRQTAINATVAGQVGARLTPAVAFATPAQIAAFAAAGPVQAATLAAIQAAATTGTASILALTPFQFLPPFQNCPNAVEACRTRDGDWSWTARLAYEFSPTLNAYASWSTGYKAPSFNLSRDSRPATFINGVPAGDCAALISGGLAVTNLTCGLRFAAAENSEVYEVGIKGNWGIAAANLTLFQQSIKNFQTNVFTGLGFAIGNAEKQETRGVEFDGYVRPTDQLTFNLAMTYLDPKYARYTASPYGDISGTSIVNIPKLSAVFGAQWDQELASGDRLIARTDFSYQSPIQVAEGLVRFGSVAANLAAARPFRAEVNDLNASLTYAMEMGLELTVWGRNLLDDRNITGIFDSTAQNGSVSGYTNQPRTYGVAARFKF